MSNAVFPTLGGLDIKVKRAPLWSTEVLTSESGKEQRAAWWSTPRFKWSLGFNYLRQGLNGNEAKTLVDFFHQHRGQFESFLFSDPYESAVTAKLFGTGTGAVAAFQLVDGTGYPVTDLNGTPTIYRTDWQGTSLLYSTARTNYAPRSQEFNLWTANNGLAVTPDTSTAPDGTLTADTLAATGGLIGYGSIIMTVASGTALRIKCWVKNIDSAQSVIYVRTSADAGRVAIFWSGPEITILGVSSGATNAQFISYPNGWYLVSFDITTNEINQTLRIYPDSFTTNKSIYAWGYQALSSDGTYIKTDATAATITDYTLSGTGRVTLAAAPLLNASMTWTGAYYRRVRFDMDELDLERIYGGTASGGGQTWEGKTVKLISVK